VVIHDKTYGHARDIRGSAISDKLTVRQDC
jgi:hypothetical protein